MVLSSRKLKLWQIRRKVPVATCTWKKVKDKTDRETAMGVQTATEIAFDRPAERKLDLAKGRRWRDSPFKVNGVETQARASNGGIRYITIRGRSTCTLLYWSPDGYTGEVAARLRPPWHRKHTRDWPENVNFLEEKSICETSHPAGQSRFHFTGRHFLVDDNEISILETELLTRFASSETIWRRQVDSLLRPEKGNNEQYSNPFKRKYFTALNVVLSCN